MSIGTGSLVNAAPRGRRLRVNVALLASAIVVVAGVLLAWYRTSMHNFPWEGDPAQLNMCGRDYNPRSDDVSGVELRRDGIVRLFPVFRAPALIGPQVYADTGPAQRGAPRQAGEPCTGSLVIIDAPDRYQIYDLSGGP